MIKKMLKITAVLMLLVVGCGFYVIGSQIADGLTLSNAGNDTQANSITQMEEWGYDYKTFESTITTKKITLMASDETLVPLYELSSKNESEPKGVVLLVHGLGGDYKSTYPQAEIYLKNNWKVYALDQRASGLSKSKVISYGYYEKRDLESCVDYIVSKHSLPIVVHGMSMGGATTGIYAGSNHANEKISGFIMDSSFDSMEGVFSLVWDDMNTGIPAELAVAVGGVVTQMKYGFNFSVTDVAKALQNSSKPALLIQCKKDTIATEAMVQKNFDAIGHKNKSIVSFDSKHVEAVIDSPVAYEATILKFIHSF